MSKKFNFPPLEEAYNEVYESFINLPDSKNQISDDIKSIEQLLKQTDISETLKFITEIHNWPISTTCVIDYYDCYGQEKADELLKPFYSKIKIKFDCLEWNVNKKRLNFCQMESKKEYEGITTSDPFPDVKSNKFLEDVSNFQIIENRPLIETPYEIRKKVLPLLTYLLKAIKAKYSINI